MRILAFAGSARRDSLNKKLVRAAAEIARTAGAEVNLIDLDHFPMPVYHGDLEETEGAPENAVKLKALFAAHDAFLISSPENNASVSALLKNTLDWISRPQTGPAGVHPYAGKCAALMAASPGAFGGVRGLAHLRQIFQNLNVLVLSEQTVLPSADQAFDESGALKNPRTRASIETQVKRLIEVTSRTA